MEYRSNLSYIFIPFSFEKQADADSLIDALNESEAWRITHDRIAYLLKYVADKLDSNDRKNCLCFHYSLEDSARGALGLPPADTWLSTAPHHFQGGVHRFRFQIAGAELFCFRTTSCVMALKIHCEKDDPYWVAATQYYLKKVSREKIFLGDGEAAFGTLLGLGRSLMAPFGYLTNFTFFGYSSPTTERANILTLLQMPPQDSYARELFYLRNCYNDGFLYMEDPAAESEEIYYASRDTVWGVSQEAAVCLIQPALGRADFLTNGFYQRFCQQYLFLYVLLLHQKYTLYMFLTKLGVGTYNDLATLEEYRSQLYEFKTDYVFSCVTEVPQHQKLYERLVKAFSLEQMYRDVHEPLTALGELRKADAEDRQKRHETHLTVALAAVSFFSLFSALVDSAAAVDLIASLPQETPVVMIVKIVLLAMLGLSTAGILLGLLISKIKSNKK